MLTFMSIFSNTLGYFLESIEIITNSGHEVNDVIQKNMFNPFLHNGEKLSNIRFLKYFWPFFIITHERVNSLIIAIGQCMKLTKS